MHFRAAKFFLIDNLTNGCFDQRRAGQIKSAAFGHQNFVAENGQISPARNTVPHDRRELRNSRRGNDRIISKDPAEIVFVRENLVLHRQKNAGRIDQINNWERTFESDSLRAQKFFYSRRKERARFHGRVVRDDHGRNARNVSDAGDCSGGDNVPPLFVHFVSRPEADFEESRVFVEKLSDSFPRRQATELALPLESGFPAALPQERFLLQNFATKIAQRLIGGCRCSGHVRRRV